MSARLRLTLPLLAAALLSAAATTATADSTDALLDGFEGTATPAAAATLETQLVRLTASENESRGDLSGSTVISSSYNFRDHESYDNIDWHGLSKLRTRLNLQYDYKWSDDWQSRVSGYGFYDWAYEIQGRSRYNSEVLDEYEHEAEWQEVWLRGKLSDKVDIKAGRQVVNWGRADSLRVLDVLNPLDNREPGIADIEDLRLPTTMIKTDWFLTDQWRASFIAIPEVRFSKNPPRGNDFESAVSPLFGSSATRIEEHEPDDISDTRYAASLAGTFSGWDISFHAAQLWRDTPYLHVDGPINPLQQGSATKQLDFRHSDITLLGAGANLVLGSWLFKSEIARLGNIDYTTASTKNYPFIGQLTLPDGNTEKDRIDVLAGVEYFGISDSSLSLEVVNRHIDDYEESMGVFYEKRDRMETAVRYTGNFMNDRLELTALAIVFGEKAQEGTMTRFQAAYDIQDALVLTTGVIFYDHGTMPPFNTIEDNDRLFAEIKYSF
jgi:hypothetical protein